MQPALSGENEPDKKYEVIEAMYYDYDTGMWNQCVLVMEGSAKTSTSMYRIHNDKFHVSPYIATRYKTAAGDVYGRSPVSSALTEARVANEIVRITLEAASIRASGVYVATKDTATNFSQAQFRAGEVITVSDINAIRALELSGDVNMAQLVLQDQRDAIKRKMMSNALPPPRGPIMSATEVVERVRQATHALGGPYARIGTELAKPVMRNTVYMLARMGYLKDISDLITVGDDAIPLQFDESDFTLQMQTPLEDSMRLIDLENAVRGLQISQAMAGPAAFQAGIKPKTYRNGYSAR